MDNGFSPTPGIRKPGLRSYEVTDQEEKASQPSRRWELESSGPHHLGTPSSGLAPSHPPLPALLYFLSYCPRLQAIRTTACVSGTEKSGEGRKEGTVYSCPLLSGGGLLVQYKESDNWGSHQSGGTQA